MPLKARRIDSELESLSKAKAAFIEPMLLFLLELCPRPLTGVYEPELDADEHGAERMEKRSGMTRPANYWYND